MARVRVAVAALMVLLLGLAAPGDAAAEPRLFQGSVVVGAPFTISNSGRIASVHGSNPASFEIAASLLGGALTLSWTMGAGMTFFSFANGAGSFGPGGGPGSAVFTPLPSHPGFRATFSGTPHRFGGTQRLLGQIVVKNPNATTLGRTLLEWPLTPIGGSFGETRKEYHGGTGGFFRTTLWGFPWTTGPVTAMGTFSLGTPLTTAAEGSDMRTPAGQGTIQLVTPFLVKRGHDMGGVQARVPRVAPLTLHFAPWPAVNLRLLCGIAGLVLLSRFARRS